FSSSLSSLSFFGNRMQFTPEEKPSTPSVGGRLWRADQPFPTSRWCLQGATHTGLREARRSHTQCNWRTQPTVHDSHSKPESRTGEPSNAAKQSQTFVFPFRRVFRMGLESDVGGACGPRFGGRLL
ncbi:hypothetical protein DBR06_SOUSAS7310068, partial [Sousa chinensis]